jgi:hypothetical protein
MIACLELVQEPIEIARQASLIDVIVTQTESQIAVRDVQQLQEPVLDLDIIVAA